MLAFLVAALGFVVLCGWAFHLPALAYIRPTFQSMKANTALSFLCLGAGLWLANNNELQRIRRTLGFLVAVIAAAALAEYAFRVNLGIDELLFRDTRTPSVSAYPGRMAIATSIGFLLLGLAVALLGRKNTVALQSALAAACFVLSLVALCGYLYGVESLYAMTAFSTMAVHTAAGLMAGSVAYFLARPGRGMVSIAASDSDSGLLLRTLFPAIILAPILIGWLQLAGQRAHLYDTPFGIVLQVLGSVGCLTVVALLTVRSMYRIERERRRVGVALRKSEEKFSKAFRESPVVVTLTRVRDQRYLDVSESFEGWTGWHRDEVIGRTPFDIGLVDPATRSELLTRLLAEGALRSFEVRFRRKDGAEMIGLGSAELIEIEDEPCALSVVADISERKRAEEALRESEQRLRLAQQAANIGSFEWNVQTGLNVWTPELEAMYGLARGEFGKTQPAWEQLVHPEDRAAAIACVDRAFATGEPVRGEWRVIWRDGSVHWISGCFQVFKTAAGDPLSLTGVNIDITERKLADAELEKYRQHLEDLVRERTQQLEATNAQLQTDITERRRAEEALRESESRFRSLFESSPIAVLMATADGGVLAANFAACAMFRMSEAEICLAGRKGLVDTSDLRVEAALEQRQRTGRVIGAEVNFLRANGERFPAELDSVIVPGRTPRAFVMVRDITERKRTEAALLRSEKLASLGRMAAAVAHEINNPLAAVMNLLFLVRGTAEIPESARHLLEMADAELTRVAHMTRQSLGFYRESTAPAPTSVNAILDSVLDLLHDTINAKHAIIEKNSKGDVQITAVAGELRQVFSNLISNSLDAINERGTIKVRVSAFKQCVRITVSDNGRGIPPNAVRHIFEPFFTTKERVGTGLGLWVSQQIVEKHGGKIRVRSRSEGKRRGTTFSVVLPMKPAPTETLLAVA